MFNYLYDAFQPWKYEYEQSTQHNTKANHQVPFGQDLVSTNLSTRSIEAFRLQDFIEK